MLSFLTHVFKYAEVYAVTLAWIVVPLLFLVGYMLMKKGGAFPGVVVEHIEPVPALPEPSVEKEANAH